MKIIVLLVCGAILAGCGAYEQGVAKFTGWSRVCVSGVSYLQFPSGVTVEYTPEGKVKGC